MRMESENKISYNKLTIREKVSLGIFCGSLVVAGSKKSGFEMDNYIIENAIREMTSLTGISLDYLLGSLHRRRYELNRHNIENKL